MDNKPTDVKADNYSVHPNPVQIHSRSNNWPLIIIAVFLLCGMVGFFGGWLGSRRDETSFTTSQNEKVVASQSQLVSSIAKSVGPSVVSVDVTSQTADTSNSSFFGAATPTQQQSAGTGIIIDSNGLIITNRHVVPAGTTTVSITLSDGTTFNNVQVVGRTAETDSLDVAILKITDTKGHKLVPAAIGDSSKMQVGDMVIAIGNALGQFQNTVTSGIISGYGRSVQAGDSSGTGNAENLGDLFQTDAAINEGNSGGPLVNTSGQVIGINTAIASGAQNIGFAIPVNDVSGLIKKVISSGKFQRVYLGVEYVTLTPDVANQLKLGVSNGAYVESSDQNNGAATVIAGSPADKAGIQEKDIIAAIDGTKIDQNNSLLSLIGQHTVGDKVTLTVIRDGKSMQIDVTLAAAP